VKIGIGADHRGYKAKQELKRFLKEKGHSVVDFGTESNDAFDYPDVAFPLARSVSKGRMSRGILICGSGIGMSIAANKVSGAYAALCTNVKMARMSRNHNNANILSLGASFTSSRKMKEIIDAWLSERFEGGRHRRRFNKIRGQES
jgi:RpiB/LacA/LacB family sugar-phosphate isomerase